ncbi:MAG: hypothetical protein IJF54_03315, partial [Clostridia bacterium]|nr:hypothetical protein [Clostridia bacterium]
MWYIISVLILIVEILLLVGFVIGRFKKKQINETVVFIATVFVVNFSMHLLPFLYNVIELGEQTNIPFGLLGCFGSAMMLFVGEPNVEAVAGFANVFTVFAVAYVLGVLIALLTTISTAIEVFSNTIINGFRVAKALKKESCDIVVGNSPKALHYAKTCNTVLLIDDSISKDCVKELIGDGYAVLHKGFTEQLLASRQFNTATRYNIVCPSSEKALDYVEAFIAYKKAETNAKHTHLYVEMNGTEAETVRREIVEKNGMEEYIDTFSTNELLARTF